ncbi:hypothetical protein N9917_00290 [Deltaproteobacteria bacterium]|nr:hypothetical protein [Deltaproteobacteria bacterium]
MSRSDLAYDRKTKVVDAPAGPMDATRVVNALQRNPQLLFDVAKRLVGAKVLGPWLKGSHFGQNPVWFRLNVQGKQVLKVERAASEDRGWLARKAQGGTVALLDSQITAQLVSDVLAVRAGWVLPDPPGYSIAVPRIQADNSTEFKDLDDRSWGRLWHVRDPEPNLTGWRWQTDRMSGKEDTRFEARKMLKGTLMAEYVVLLSADVTGL